MKKRFKDRLQRPSGNCQNRVYFGPTAHIGELDINNRRIDCPRLIGLSYRAIQFLIAFSFSGMAWGASEGIPVPVLSPHPSPCPSPCVVYETCVQQLIQTEIKSVYESTATSAAKCLAIQAIIDQKIEPMMAATSNQVLAAFRQLTCSTCPVLSQDDNCPWDETKWPDILLFEAEGGILTAPMAVGVDTNAVNGKFVSTTVSNSGQVDYPFLATSTGPYVVWGRNISIDDSHNSFIVSLDTGPTDIYDTSGNTYWSNWQWSEMGGRAGTSVANTIFPRTFSVAIGTHTVHVKGRETGTKLDELMITNQLSFVPN